MPHRKLSSSFLGLSLVFAISAACVCVDGQGLVSEKIYSPLHEPAVQETAMNTVDASVVELRQIEDWPTRLELSAEFVQLLTQRRPARCRQLLDDLFAEALEWNITGEAKLSDTESRIATIQRIIQIAASFNRILARSYIDKYEENETFRMAAGRPPARMRPALSAIDLAVATTLVEKDPLFAVSVARRSLVVGIMPETLIFLEKLRQRDPRLAAGFFSSAMESIESRRGYDINELFLLHSYAFSSPQVFSLLGQGLVRQQIPTYQETFREHSVDSVLAKSYLGIALLLLLDTRRFTPGADLNGRIVGDLYFLKMIETEVLLYLPTMRGGLFNQQELLTSSLDSNGRTSVKEAVGRWKDTRAQSETGNDRESAESMIGRADEMAESPERDRLYYEAAVTAVSKKDYRGATNIADKLSDATRDAAKQFIVFSIAQMNLKDGRYAQAAQWSRRDGDLVRRAYIFNKIAYSLMERQDITRALEFLGEVQQISSGLDANKEKVSTLIGESAVYSGFDKMRASDLLIRAIEVANNDPAFTGDNRIYRSLDIGDFSFSYSMYDDKLGLAAVVRQIGRVEFYQTLSILQSLKGRVPRLRAIFALCMAVITNESIEKSILDDRKANGNKKQRTKKILNQVPETP